MLDTDMLTVPALFLFILTVRLGLLNTQNLILYEEICNWLCTYWVYCSFILQYGELYEY